MGFRVKNVAAGFVDATGFHPIRRSPDYDPDRAGDEYGARTDAAGLRRRRKRVTKRTTARRRTTAPRPARKRTTRKRTVVKRPVPRTRTRRKNPIPSQWVPARVKRLGHDIQVMLFPRRKARRSVRRKR
jgi:hypothetical protein